MDNKKAKRLSKEEIKIIGFDDYRWNCRIWRSKQKAEKIEDLEKAVKIIKQYEDIIKTKNKGIINVAYHQGQVFKRFKKKEKFVKLVSELRIHKTTIIFRINIFKLCKKHPKLLKSSIGLGFFKNHHKEIKAICEENEKIFNTGRFYLLKLSLWHKSLLEIESIYMHSFSFLVIKN